MRLVRSGHESRRREHLGGCAGATRSRINLPPFRTRYMPDLTFVSQASRGSGMGYSLVFFCGGQGGLPLSAKAARFGLRFARGGIAASGRIVDVERGRRTVLDSDGGETIVRTMAGRHDDGFVAVSQRGQWRGRGGHRVRPRRSGISRTRRSGSASKAGAAPISPGSCGCRCPSLYSHRVQLFTVGLVPLLRLYL